MQILINFYCLGFHSLISFKSLLPVVNFARKNWLMHLSQSSLIIPSPSPEKKTTGINLVRRPFPIVCMEDFHKKSGLWITWESKHHFCCSYFPTSNAVAIQKVRFPGWREETKATCNLFHKKESIFLISL